MSQINFIFPKTIVKVPIKWGEGGHGRRKEEYIAGWLNEILQADGINIKNVRGRLECGPKRFEFHYDEYNARLVDLPECKNCKKNNCGLCLSPLPFAINVLAARRYYQSTQ